MMRGLTVIESRHNPYFLTPHTVFQMQETGQDFVGVRRVSVHDVSQPVTLEISNAGLSLLFIWLPCLFEKLDLLSTSIEGKKDFKDIESRIRAIFILQRLVAEEEREYKEQEFALNRILTACPFHIPLPRKQELAKHELQSVDSILKRVQTDWETLKHTSVQGLQRSFIERPGRLEAHEDVWVLYVESRAYDVLLDSCPWSFNGIRLPWLKKRIVVVWREKTFDWDGSRKRSGGFSD